MFEGFITSMTRAEAREGEGNVIWGMRWARAAW